MSTKKELMRCESEHERDRHAWQHKICAPCLVDSMEMFNLKVEEEKVEQARNVKI